MNEILSKKLQSKSLSDCSFINLCLKANSIIGIHKVALKVFLFFYKRKSLIYMPGGCS